MKLKETLAGAASAGLAGAVTGGIGSIVSGGLGLLGGLFKRNHIVTGKLMQQAWEYEKEGMGLQYNYGQQAANAEYKRNLQMWKDTNFGAQRNEMEKAGLSVGLMYGNGGGQAASTAGGQATQPSGATSNPVGMALQYKQIEQAILKKELYLTSTSTDEQAFGYQEAWAEYRMKPNRISGKFRSNATGTLDCWHYGDNYKETPNLSQAWMKEGDSEIQRTLAVDNEPCVS